MKYHERLIPFGESNKTYTYAEAEEMVSNVFTNLNKEFGTKFNELVNKGLIDAFPQNGKKGGAACYSGMATMPPYLYLNFEGKLRDVTTLAHESGHALHHEFSKKQNALNQGVSLSTAEVASTFMEEMTLDALTSELSEKERLGLLVSQLDSDISSIFRQIALYNFETELHAKFKEKLSLSQKEIGELFLKHMGSYMGEAVILDKGSENWWVYWSHIRRFFYVYSYASGQLISKALQHEVKKDKKFVAKVKQFLSAGQSKSTRDIFLDLGIDIADKKFWEAGLTEIDMQLHEAEILAKKLGYK